MVIFVLIKNLIAQTDFQMILYTSDGYKFSNIRICQRIIIKNGFTPYRRWRGIGSRAASGRQSTARSCA